MHWGAAHHDPLQRGQFEIGCFNIFQKARPDCRDTYRNRHTFIGYEMREAFTIRMTTRKYEFCSCGGRGERKPPCTGMKHRHDGQHDIMGRNSGDIRLKLAHGMQIISAVCIGHTLGRACRTRREAKAARSCFREISPGDVRVFARDNLLESLHRRQSRCVQHVAL